MGRLVLDGGYGYERVGLLGSGVYEERQAARSGRMASLRKAAIGSAVRIAPSLQPSHNSPSTISHWSARLRIN